MGNKIEKDSAESVQNNKVTFEEPSKNTESIADTESLRGKKKNKGGLILKICAVIGVCIIVILGAALSNESIRTAIKPVFGFGDKDIEIGADQGVIDPSKSSAISNNIRITLDNCSYNTDKIGLYLKVNFGDKKILKNAKSVSLEFRIKEANDEYLIDFVSDNKPARGKANIIDSRSEGNSGMDTKNGVVRCDFVFESLSGKFPPLENATIEIECVTICDKNNNVKVINGAWNLRVRN